jgi:hypothetical protein
LSVSGPRAEVGDRVSAERQAELRREPVHGEDGGLLTAAISPCGGLDDMFTVWRLGFIGRHAATLVCANTIESMSTVARSTTDVKRWRATLGGSHRVRPQ